MEKPSDLDLQIFEYSKENPPPLEILENKVFAVHVTDRLPANGILKAEVKSLEDDQDGSSAPPSFRPTLHFSLGEVVKDHSDFSWDHRPYAIISPLGKIKNQLVNISPQDTFILGSLPLKDGTIIVVPKETKTEFIPEGV